MTQRSQRIPRNHPLRVAVVRLYQCRAALLALRDGYSRPSKEPYLDQLFHEDVDGLLWAIRTGRVWLQHDLPDDEQHKIQERYGDAEEREEAARIRRAVAWGRHHPVRT